MISEAVVRAWLTRSWWVVWPAFTVLVIRLTAQRTCGDPYGLLESWMTDARWALPVAFVYVLAHAWTCAAYLVTVSRSQALVPELAAWRTCWGRDRWQLLLMAAVLAIEYAPLTLWSLIGARFGCAAI